MLIYVITFLYYDLKFIHSSYLIYARISISYEQKIVENNHLGQHNFTDHFKPPTTILNTLSSSLFVLTHLNIGLIIFSGVKAND